jgi:hypothetical protein
LDGSGAIPCVLWGRGQNRETTLHFSLSTSFTSRQSLALPHPSSPGTSDDTPLDVKSFVNTMAPKFKDGDIVFAFSGKWVSWVHTVVAYGQYSMIEQLDSLLTRLQLLSSAR